MTDQVTRPTLARRHLGRMLRRLRHEAGKTHADVTAAHLGSRSKMSAIESGRIPVGADTIYGLSALYGVPLELTEQLLALAAATKRAGGRAHSVDPSIPEPFSVYGDLIDSASLLRIHCVELIHELLQTEDYARAVIAADAELPPDAVEQRVAFGRLRREAFWHREPPARLEVVVTAGVLNLVVGSPAVMQDQLAHLRAVDATTRVDVRVLTAANGVHATMRGGFVLMEFGDPLDPPLVYVDKVTGAEYVEREDHLVAYRRVFDAITALSVPIGAHP